MLQAGGHCTTPHRLILLPMLAGLALAGPARAQDDSLPGGLQFGMTVSQELRAEEDALLTRTGLGFALTTVTRREALQFQISGTIDTWLDDPPQEQRVDIEDPRFQLSYSLQSRETLLETGLSYTRDDIDTATEQSETAALEVSPGQEEDAAANASLTFGREARFGGTLRLGWAQTRYFDTPVASSLIDSTSNTGALRLRFELARAVTAFAELSHSDLDRDGGTDVRRTVLTGSLETTLSETVQANLDLSATQIDQETAAGVRSTTQGIGYGLSVVAERPNGTLSGLLDSTISENGRRTELRLNRRFTLPRAALSMGTGISRSSTTGANDPLYNIGYVHDSPRTQVNADFSQRFATTSAGEESLESRLSMGVQQSLTGTAGLSATLALSSSDLRSATGADSSQARFSVSYNQSLTDRWVAYGGFSHVLRQTDGLADTRDNALFFGLRAAFDWRP